jgi:glycosyltransferase involved in cell wall biosynthesis
VIAGPHHETAAETAGRISLLDPHPNILLEGFVSDVRPAYASADVVAVPLPLSAGTNIKILEAMACGRAIVSTPSGCRGLNLTRGEDLIVTELDGSFARAILTLFEDEPLRRTLAAEARRTAEERFSWESIAEDAFGSYMQLLGAGVPAAAVSLSKHR